jgi:hypothetical protein
MWKGERIEREEGKKTMNMHQTMNILEKLMKKLEKETTTSTKADPKQEERTRSRRSGKRTLQLGARAPYRGTKTLDLSEIHRP